MSKEKNQTKGGYRLSKASKKLLVNYFALLIGYTAAVLIAVLMAETFCDRFLWYWSDPVYQILKFIKDYLLFFVVAVLLVGWIVLTYRFIKKLLGYLDEVANAAKYLAEPEEKPIELSDALSYTENEFNRVREQALYHARAAREAEQRKNELVMYLAHDLKTPLTSVIGYLSLLRDEGQISEGLRKKYLSISLEKAERLEDLINEFFEITRFNLSEMVLEYSQVNLTRMLEQLTFEFQPMLLEKNLHCDLKAEPHVTVRGDRDKLQRVFDNLLRNAVNYCFEGGTITITLTQLGQEIHILVENPGNPIPEEKLRRIFEQFYRLDSARSSRSGGAGLGLAIAKEIVEHHGGRIEARSRDEQIAFEVIIPAL